MRIAASALSFTQRTLNWTITIPLSTCAGSQALSDLRFYSWDRCRFWLRVPEFNAMPYSVQLQTLAGGHACSYILPDRFVYGGFCSTYTPFYTFSILLIYIYIIYRGIYSNKYKRINKLVMPLKNFIRGHVRGHLRCIAVPVQDRMPLKAKSFGGIGHFWPFALFLELWLRLALCLIYLKDLARNQAAQRMQRRAAGVPSTNRSRAGRAPRREHVGPVATVGNGIVYVSEFLNATATYASRVPVLGVLPERVK